MFSEKKTHKFETLTEFWKKKRKMILSKFQKNLYFRNMLHNLRGSGYDMIENLELRREKIGNLGAQLIDAEEDLEDFKQIAQAKVEALMASVKSKQV